ncbi:MAG TPA: amino acid adenylation domain-containing protein, partial [Candidatus Nanopelagicales bacterium]|nr:amino acid adenylation domain-containing protein [Candidatus Nanopelagicales bacterium]
MPSQRTSGNLSIRDAELSYTPEERDQVAKTLCELFQETAARHPDSVAVRDAERTWTYRELEGRIARLSSYLRQRGVTREVVVGIAVERSAEMLCGLLAILKAGGSYVPMDPTYPVERLAHMAEDAGIRLYLTEESALDRLPLGGAEAICIDRDRSAIASAEPLSPEVLPAPGDRAYVLYTSGSTGKPKGVEIEHRSLTNLLFAVRKLTHVGPRDVFLATTALSFDVAATELYLPLIVGGSVWVARRGDLSDRESFDAVIAKSGCTCLQATPSGWKMVIRMGWQGSPGLSLFTVGEPLPKDLADEMSRRGKVVWNFYGPTEATVYATCWKVDPGAGEVLVGTPLAGYHVKVADGDGHPVSIGEIGELWLGGVGVARGYLGRPELTRERFVDGFYRTGDLARMRPDGNLYLLGRADDQVKIRGYRVELGDIEASLKGHPSIMDVVTVKRQGKDDEEGGERLVSYYIAQASASSAGDEIFAQLFDAAYRHQGDREETVKIGQSEVYTGYHSSYTGKPMPPEEIKEFAETTIERVLALKPRRIYEIGCGVGLLALPLAARCERYAGSDFSQAAVELVQRELARQGLEGAAVWRGDGNDFSRIADGEYDVIVLNSVIQYFPDAHYTLSVLRQAAKKLPPGGVLFVGDVRSADLLEPFLSDLLRARSGGSISPEELASRVKVALQVEKELLFSPEFFHALAAELPEIDRVRVELRQGRFDNEFSRFRYDVFLYVGSKPSFRASQPVHAWKRDLDGLSSVEELLRRRESELVAFSIEGVPNARIPGKERDPRAVHPDRFRELAGRYGWQVSIPWSLSGEPGDYDVQFFTGGAEEACPSQRPDRHGPLKSPEAYVRARRDVALEARLSHELRDWLLARLPEYMVPSQFIAVDAFPLTANGKIDKGALPPPESVRPQLEVPFVAPRSDIERRICLLVEEQLGVRPVGVHDSFFDLGGNSMSALAVTGRLEQQLGRRVPVIDFVREPTVENLVRLAQGDARSSDTDAPFIAVNPKGSKAPFFCVHGAGGLAYPLMDLAQLVAEDRPVYVFQDPANTGKHAPKETLAEMARAYVEVVKQLAPRGPYYLGGYCFGGVVAYEMAQQLRSGGEQVAELVMIDAPIPRDFREGFEGNQRILRQIK